MAQVTGSLVPKRERGLNSQLPCLGPQPHSGHLGSAPADGSSLSLALSLAELNNEAHTHTRRGHRSACQPHQEEQGSGKVAYCLCFPEGLEPQFPTL